MIRLRKREMANANMQVSLMSAVISDLHELRQMLQTRFEIEVDPEI